MQPHKILTADVLDIIFENRNKTYGAYALRKTYNNRLLIALGTMLAACSLFFWQEDWQFGSKIMYAINKIPKVFLAIFPPKISGSSL